MYVCCTSVYETHGLTLWSITHHLGIFLHPFQRTFVTINANDKTIAVTFGYLTAPIGSMGTIVVFHNYISIQLQGLIVFITSGKKPMYFKTGEVGNIVFDMSAQISYAVGNTRDNGIGAPYSQAHVILAVRIKYVEQPALYIFSIHCYDLTYLAFSNHFFHHLTHGVACITVSYAKEKAC